MFTLYSYLFRAFVRPLPPEPPCCCALGITPTAIVPSLLLPLDLDLALELATSILLIAALRCRFVFLLFHHHSKFRFSVYFYLDMSSISFVDQMVNLYFSKSFNLYHILCLCNLDHGVLGRNSIFKFYFRFFPMS